MLSEFKNDYGVELIFSNGTSLSKGWGLINRFSEDFDFIISLVAPVLVSDRSAFRQSILKHITSASRFTFKEDDITIGREDHHWLV